MGDVHYIIKKFVLSFQLYKYLKKTKGFINIK